MDVHAQRSFLISFVATLGVFTSSGTLLVEAATISSVGAESVTPTTNPSGLALRYSETLLAGATGGEIGFVIPQQVDDFVALSPPREQAYTLSYDLFIVDPIDVTSVRFFGNAGGEGIQNFTVSSAVESAAIPVGQWVTVSHPFGVQEDGDGGDDSLWSGRVDLRFHTGSLNGITNFEILIDNYTITDEGGAPVFLFDFEGDVAGSPPVGMVSANNAGLDDSLTVFEVVAVPEPSVALLLFVAGGVFYGRFRRRPSSGVFR